MKEDGYITDAEAAPPSPAGQGYTLSNDFAGPNGYLLSTWSG